MSKEDFTETRPRRGDRGLFGMVLLFAGVAWFLSRAGMLHVAADTLLSILLICIGAGLLLTRRSGRRAWPILLGGILLFVLMGSSASAHVHWGGSSQVTFMPRSISQLHHPYQLGAGDLRLDLTKLDFSGSLPIKAQVGAGELDVIVPRDVQVQVKYQDGIGGVTLDGHDFGHGFVSNGTWSSGSSGGSRELVLDLQVGAGQINLTRGIASAPAAPSAPNAPSAPVAPSLPAGSS